MNSKKLYEKILNGSTRNIKFDELVKLVEDLGFVLDRISGSHHIFKHPQIPTELLNLQPKDSEAKPYQVKQVVEKIKDYNLELGGE